MSVFKALNVGQGDSMILKPTEECKYNRETFVIDLGTGMRDITQYIDAEDNVHIILTHHDNDHIGGFHFFVDKIEQVKEIVVPLYQNEITLIARAILNLKGINQSKECNEFVNALEEIVRNQVILKTLIEGGKYTRLDFAYEGKRFCGHIECLNPPCIVESYNWLKEASQDGLIQLMYELFTKEFAREMELYIRANVDRSYFVDSLDFRNYWLESQDEKAFNSRNGSVKCNYVLDFIMKNEENFRKFNNQAIRENLWKIYEKYVGCTHDVCAVIKTDFNNKTMLLTGDASKKVFNRLIREGKNISATYLKMPHHGSKHNITESILNAINPQTAIISHDNGHFGKSKDTHPNQEVLELLQSKRIKVLITNDVVKNNIVIMKKAITAVMIM